MNDIENQVKDIIEGVKTGTKKPITHVAIILDRSSSMNSIRYEAIDAYNQQIDTIKKMTDENEVYLNLVTFSSFVDKPIYWNESMTNKGLEGLKLDSGKYVPNGMTALKDAIGQTITKLDDQHPVKKNEDVSFLIVIVSDGQENNSKEWISKLAEKIDELTNRGNWTFVYLGTNQDVVKEANNMNMYLGNTMYYEYSGGGMKSAAVNTSMATRSYFESRTAGSRQVKDFYANDYSDGSDNI